MSVATATRVDLVIETDAHEGPVHVAAEDALYFTTVPRPRPAGPRVDIRRLDLSTRRLTTVRADANAANGMTLAPDGRLLVCEQGSRTTPAAVTLVDRASGRTGTTPRPATWRWWRTASTSPTAWPSRPTSARSTWATAAPSTAPATTTPADRG